MQNVYSARYRAFVKRLTLARESKGLTQRQVAKALKIPQPRLSRMETGERRVDVIELDDLATYYGKSLKWFVPRR